MVCLYRLVNVHRVSELFFKTILHHQNVAPNLRRKKEDEHQLLIDVFIEEKAVGGNIEATHFHNFWNHPNDSFWRSVLLVITLRWLNVTPWS